MATPCPKSRGSSRGQRLAAFWLIGGVLSMIIALSSFAPADASFILADRYKNLCGGKPMITKKHEKPLTWLVKHIGDASLAQSTSPQHEAACWMFRENKKFSPQRYILAVLYYATQGLQWEISTDWMTQKHECGWFGVNCDYWRNVVGLELGFIKVNGIVPRELGLLTKLKDLDLHGNDLQGVIPHRLMAGMKNLEYLRLHMNGMFGAIHKEIARMTKLKEIHLFGNYMGGTIPKELAQLKKLEVIDFYANMLEGTIPKELAKLPKLRFLDVHDNNLVGTMPKEICDRKLEGLIADCHGRNPEVKCDCCTVCCQGLPAMICIDQKTGKQVSRVDLPKEEKINKKSTTKTKRK